jgi:hypothetical protein
LTEHTNSPILDAPELTDSGSAPTVYASAYDQPVDDSEDISTGLSNQSHPYEYPEPVVEVHNAGVDSSIPTPQGSLHYQELSQCRTTQNPTGYQHLIRRNEADDAQQSTTTAHAYEPLCLDNAASSEYQELNPYCNKD